jgi:Patatin-like phospholipase
MADDSDPRAQPKSLADILAEELDGKVGADQTQDLPLVEKQERLRAVYDRIHAEQPERSALCLSGGGIRSAIFGLGILQGLARYGLLREFDYLSTVSGGGYVGGWLTAWIRNHPQGAAGVVEELRRRPDQTLNPEPEPIRHLRAFSNYLTPRAGLMSVDSWALIATYIRNVFLNWLVLISWLAAAMMIPRLYLAAILLPRTGWVDRYEQTVYSYGIALNILLGVSFVLVALAMAYAIVDVPSTGNAGFSQVRFLNVRQLPLLVAALALSEWWALTCNIYGSESFRSTEGMLKFIIFAVTTYLAGGLFGSIFLWFRPRDSDEHLLDSLLRLGTILITTAFGGLCLWAIATRVFYDPAGGAINYVCFAPALLFGVLLLVNFLFTGLASWVSEDQDREWWARSAAWILIMICGWIAINVLVLWGAQAFTDSSDHLVVFLGQVQENPMAKAIFAAFGGMTGLVGLLLTFRSKVSKSLGSSRASQWILVILALVFFVLLSIVISSLLLFVGSQPWAVRVARWFGGSEHAYEDQLFVVFFLSAASLLFGIVMGFFINVNKFSLHATYRARLIRAFLGASRTEATRRPHKFTGFDPEDNFPLYQLKSDKPFHVIGAALNLVKGSELAWQERKAESFTMSRLHSGSWHLGYRPSIEYGEAISLGTALTISGAAASSNMGYHSSPIVGFLMTLFNVRLGWWLGNPGTHGASTWRRSGPGYAVGPLFSEAIGNTTDHYKYVNLSDGGHFENLGFYEMVLRRCKFILLVDAGQDFDYVFEDLGNAIRKIRIDLGIPIEIKVVSPKKSEGTINHCALGTIRYSEVDGPGTDGAFIYVKPVISGDEPPDVANYAAAHPEFPHEATTDQWFGESQLESYRLLGMHAVESICGKGWKPKSLPLFFAQVKQDLETGKSRAA